MRTRTLTARSLRHYWRSHLAVILGVAVACAVLGGSLVVGDSVRGSLAAAALSRLGRTSHAVESSGFFDAALTARLGAQPVFDEEFGAAAPLLALRGAVSHATSQRRASEVLVYGVDERFWAFHGLDNPGLDGRQVLLSAPLASELNAAAEDAVLVRLDAAPDIPGSSLFGRRDDPGRTLRLSVAGSADHAAGGEFALRPQSRPVRAAFVPLGLLQRAVDQPGRVNLLLVAARGEAAATQPALAKTLAGALRLEDLGVRLEAVPDSPAFQLETSSALLDDALVGTARRLAREQNLDTVEVLVYLANALRAGDREVPYSIVAALDRDALHTLGGPTDDPAPTIVLNEWAAHELAAVPGATLTLDYYLWRDEGRLETASADFTVAAVTPMRGLAADAALVPAYPGITETARMAEWDPPFPVDLGRIRDQDEAYWERHRATPKAFVPLTIGQRLWSHRLGRLTALRFTPAVGSDGEQARARFATALRETLVAEPAAMARFPIVPVRELALRSARGSTDFGEYFFYFSFFLMIGGLLLAGLFFRLGLEQRLRELGLLEAFGFSESRRRRLFLGEGLGLACLGAGLGTPAAVGYAAAVLSGLRWMWSDGIEAPELQLHATPAALLLGALGTIVASTATIAWTLRDLRSLSPRRLLVGQLTPWSAHSPRGAGRPLLLTAIAVGLLLASGLGGLALAVGFFGAGALLLVAALLEIRRRIERRPRQASAIRSVTRLGFRGVGFRPGRSLLCVALVAAASFVIVSVGAFRHAGVDVETKTGEAGGYRLLAWSLVPLHHDPGTPDGLEQLGLGGAELSGATVTRFRARRGDDASCLNLYRPEDPTVLAPEAGFGDEQRFSFQATLAETAAERENPWRLLDRDREPDGAIPALADASSLAYILHRRLGDTMTLGDSGVRVRFVGTLAPGLFQGELLVAERHFLEAFPEEAGYRFFLIDVPSARAAALGETLEAAFSDFGLDVSQTSERLRGFHRVENTYIATFQALGALGLLLGSVGLASVLVRNALEQRGALALLSAVGFRRRQLARLVFAENGLLVALGFLAGAVPALLAIVPALAGRQGTSPLLWIATLAAVLALTSALVSWLAVAVIRRWPLLASLRSE